MQNTLVEDFLLSLLSLVSLPFMHVRCKGHNCTWNRRPLSDLTSALAVNRANALPAFFPHLLPDSFP